MSSPPSPHAGPPSAGSPTVGGTTDPTALAALVAAVDGLCASVLLAETPPDRARLRAVLPRALGADALRRTPRPS